MAKKTATNKSKPASKPAAKQAVKATAKPAAKATAKVAARPAKTPAKSPAKKLAKKPALKPIKAIKAIKKLSKKAAAKPAPAKPVFKAAKKPVAKPLDKASAKSAPKKAAAPKPAAMPGGKVKLTPGLVTAMKAALTRNVAGKSVATKNEAALVQASVIVKDESQKEFETPIVSQAGPIIKSQGSRPMGRGSKNGTANKLGPKPARTAATQAAITAIDSRLTKQRAEAKAFAIDAARLLHDLKCEHIVLMDVCRLSSTTDFIVVASGSSDRQMRSCGEQIADLARKANHGDVRVQADDRATWVLTDCSDVVVHIFEPNTRAHYDIESLWGDSVRVEWKR